MAGVKIARVDMICRLGNGCEVTCVGRQNPQEISQAVIYNNAKKLFHVHIAEKHTDDLQAFLEGRIGPQSKTLCQVCHSCVIVEMGPIQPGPNHEPGMGHRIGCEQCIALGR